MAVFNPAAVSSTSEEAPPTNRDNHSEYLMMQPAPSGPHPTHTYQNVFSSSSEGVGVVVRPTADADIALGVFREQAPAYAVSGQAVRDRINSSDSSVSGGPFSPPLPLSQVSDTSSLLDTMEEYNARRLPAPLEPTPADASSKPHLGPDPILMRDTGSVSPSDKSTAAEVVVPAATTFKHYSPRPGPGGMAPPPRATLASGSQQKSMSFDDTSPAPSWRVQEQAPPVSLLRQRSSSMKHHSLANDRGPPPQQRSRDSSTKPLTSPQPKSKLPLGTSPAKERQDGQALVKDFPSVPFPVCCEALERHHGNIAAAREELQVHTLMAMGLPHITPDDCHRALHHCQGKMDRAASWLLEMSSILAAQKT